MREVEIKKPGFLANTKTGIAILCPATFNFAHGEKEALYCNVDCAWFRIDYRMEMDVSGIRNIFPDEQAAYCKNHCIGKISQATDKPENEQGSHGAKE